MIFVTTGTHKTSFDRLIKAVDKQIQKGNIKEEVIVQTAKTSVKSNNIKFVNMLDIEEFNKIITSANLIITHGGVGTILDGLKNNKIVIACPRLSKYKEALNDHQLEIINKFSDMGYIIPLKDPNKLEKALKEAKIFKPKKYKSNTEKMVKLIEDFIDKN